MRTQQKSLVDELIAERKLEELREIIKGKLSQFVDRPKVRNVAARLFAKLTDLWGLTALESRTLVGISKSEQESWLSGDVANLGIVEFEKIACLIGIYSNLFTLYSGHADRVDRWLRRRNDGDLFRGSTPYEFLAGESPNVFYLVRQQLAAETV